MDQKHNGLNKELFVRVIFLGAGQMPRKLYQYLRCEISFLHQSSRVEKKQFALQHLFFAPHSPLVLLKKSFTFVVVTGL